MINILRKTTLGLLLLASSLYASNVEIKNAYVRATPPGMSNSATFLTLINKSNENIALVKVTSKIAKNVELHTHEMKDGAMMMYQVPKVDVKANSKTMLKPGGFHVMLIGLTKALKVDDKIAFTFIFSNKEEISIMVPVKSVMQGMKSHKMDKMKKMNHGHGKDMKMKKHNMKDM